MPTFDIAVEFEVFCSCGNHMCGETDTRNSRNRNSPQAVVNPCPRCLSAATTPLEERIAELEDLLEEAKSHIP